MYIHVYVPVPNSKYRSPASLPAHHHHGQPQQTATQSSNHVSSLLPLYTRPCKHSIRVCRRIYELVPNRKAHLVQHRDPANSLAAWPSLAPRRPLPTLDMGSSQAAATSRWQANQTKPPLHAPVRHPVGPKCHPQGGTEAVSAVCLQSLFPFPRRLHVPPYKPCSSAAVRSHSV